LLRVACPDAICLVDGFRVADLGYEQMAVVDGDCRSAAISAASILAKVTRDRMMVEMHQRWPEYEFAQHKGYVTPEHAAALQQHGPCPEHRASYVNVRRAAARLSLLENGWVDAVPPVDRAEEIA
jgi:ribonuclease HII